MLPIHVHLKHVNSKSGLGRGQVVSGLHGPYWRETVEWVGVEGRQMSAGRQSSIEHWICIQAVVNRATYFPSPASYMHLSSVSSNVMVLRHLGKVQCQFCAIYVCSRYHTLSEQLAHSAVDLRLKEIGEFLHGSEMNKNPTLPCTAVMLFASYTSVSRLINTEPSELLRLRLSEPIASQSVGQGEFSVTENSQSETRAPYSILPLL